MTLSPKRLVRLIVSGIYGSEDEIRSVRSKRIERNEFPRGRSRAATALRFNRGSSIRNPACPKRRCPLPGEQAKPILPQPAKGRTLVLAKKPVVLMARHLDKLPSTLSLERGEMAGESFWRAEASATAGQRVIDGNSSDGQIIRKTVPHHLMPRGGRVAGRDVCRSEGRPRFR